MKEECVGWRGIEFEDNLRKKGDMSLLYDTQEAGSECDLWRKQVGYLPVPVQSVTCGGNKAATSRFRV